jgi:hypothetical protein
MTYSLLAAVEIVPLAVVMKTGIPLPLALVMAAQKLHFPASPLRTKYKISRSREVSYRMKYKT